MENDIKEIGNRTNNDLLTKSTLLLVDIKKTIDEKKDKNREDLDKQYNEFDEQYNKFKKLCNFYLNISLEHSEDKYRKLNDK